MTLEEITKPLWDYMPDQLIGMIDEQLEEFVNKEKSAAVHKALEEAARLQDELRDKHFDDYNEDEIVYNGILSLKEKY